MPSTSPTHPPAARGTLPSFPWPPVSGPEQGKTPPSPILSGFPSLPPDIEMRAASEDFPSWPPSPKDTPVENNDTGFPSWPPPPHTSSASSSDDFPSWPPPALAAPDDFPSWPPPAAAATPGPAFSPWPPAASFAASTPSPAFPPWPPLPPARASPPSSGDGPLPPTGTRASSPAFPSWPGSPALAGPSHLCKEPAEVGPIRHSRLSRASSRSKSKGLSRSCHRHRREPSPVFNHDLDPDFKLFRMPLPYHATPASSEEDNADAPRSPIRPERVGTAEGRGDEAGD